VADSGWSAASGGPASPRRRNLQRALDSRVIIEQAKGLLAVRHDLDVAAAFDAMRSYARSHKIELHIVARDIVALEINISVIG
jgi:AmiR/NasT family two-component response regulator